MIVRALVCYTFRATETMLAEAMLPDLRARAARVCWCKCTGRTTNYFYIYVIILQYHILYILC